MSLLDISTPQPTPPLPVASLNNNQSYLPQQQVQQQPQQQQQASLLGAPSHQVTDLFKSISMASEGVLYQDEYVQIGFKSEFSKGMGRMMLYFGNVTQQALVSFQSNVAAQPNVSFNIQPTPSVVEPRMQIQQLLAMNCLSPEFSSPPPTLKVSFFFLLRLDPFR